jgi:5-methylcytosine-specific restriction endonuclease McrA
MQTIKIRDKTNGGKCPKCGCETGVIATVNGQDTVRCQSCDHGLYNAPKTETGREARSTSTVHAAIKPKQRDRIIQRANTRCERCGKSAMASVTGLHVGHILSVNDGLKHGLETHVINSDDNLLAECDECNGGHNRGSLPVRLFVTLLMTRVSAK